MKKKTFFPAYILAALLLCSCRSTIGVETEGTAGSTEPVFSSYQYQDEIAGCLTADVEIQIPQSDFLCPLYQTKMFQMSYEDYEQIKESVFKDKTLSSQDRIEEDDFTYYSETTESDELLNYSQGTYGSGLYYHSPQYDSIMTRPFTDNNSIPWWSEEDLERTGEELAFASRQETIEKLSDFLEEMFHISVADQAEIYALDQQALKTLAQKSNEDTGDVVDKTGKVYKTKEEWSKEEECYTVIFQEKLNSLPILTDFNNSNAMNAIEPTSIEFIYQNGEIIYFDIENPYRDSEPYDQVKLLPFDDIADAMHKKYDSVIWDEDEEQTVQSVELVYYADFLDEEKMDIRLRPVWIFEVSNSIEASGKKVKQLTHILFDAETGKEVIGNQ